MREGETEAPAEVSIVLNDSAYEGGSRVRSHKWRRT
jgi:hypothetical protein